jgi:hypothetical protein
MWIQSPIRFHDVVLHQLSTGTALTYIYIYNFFFLRNEKQENGTKHTLFYKLVAVPVLLTAW